jgi:hypothetical protein
VNIDGLSSGTSYAATAVEHVRDTISAEVALERTTVAEISLRCAWHTRVVLVADSVGLASGGPGGIVLDTALSSTVSGSDESHVSLISPGGTPRVLHDPEVLAGGGVGSVPNDESGMVEVSSALSVEDSILVGLESETSGINTDGDGLNGDSIHHGGHVIGDGGTLSNSNKLSSFGVVVSASFSLGNVRVVSLSHGLGSSSSVKVVIVGPCGETSIASLVLEELVIAIKELRLGESGKSVTLDLPDTFEASSGGERPA